MDESKFLKIRKFGFEFLSIFIGVFAAFALNSWNENQKNKETEIKILTEIHKGLKQDFNDMTTNEHGHTIGISATQFFVKVLNNQSVQKDSVHQYYFHLFRSFISIQNVSGYEALKSKGLELIENDSLRSEIISLYENDYSALRKIEENYGDLQFQQSYFQEFNSYVSQNFEINDKGKFVGVIYPFNVTKKEKNILGMILWKIRTNRRWVLTLYADVKKKNLLLQNQIEKELKFLIE